LFCLQPLSAIHPEKEGSNSLNIERSTRKRRKKGEIRRKKAGVKRKKRGKIGQMTKFGGK
jgi:hypothetical protein